MTSHTLQAATPLTIADIAAPFDGNAAFREAELGANNDPAYRALQHHLTRLIRTTFNTMKLKMLDAGCGVGALTRHLVDHGANVTAVDPSRISIDFAQRRNPDCRVFATSLELFAQCSDNRDFDLVVANQVLQCVPDLESFINAAYKVLKPGGAFIASLPRPGHYLASREDVDGFIPYCERPYRIRFRIRGNDYHPHEYWYFHREMLTYLNVVSAAGFRFVRGEGPEHVGPGRSFDTVLIVALAERGALALRDELRGGRSRESFK